MYFFGLFLYFTNSLWHTAMLLLCCYGVTFVVVYYAHIMLNFHNVVVYIVFSILVTFSLSGVHSLNIKPLMIIVWADSLVMTMTITVMSGDELRIEVVFSFFWLHHWFWCKLWVLLTSFWMYSNRVSAFNWVAGTTTCCFVVCLLYQLLHGSSTG